ncbi:GAF domain-containing protein [Chromohalobacter sp. TMW 2.2308]|uniref:GAF domain-containing protein n=1 Tax=Chromohalobacter moromii TaxID=2860329 RepID=A0A9X3B6K5_9GAMM|nr:MULTISPECIES: GAF domain-containing protein [Chromohalobacter]MCK2043858.1 GAF domain-containing protein [Chromohalobacter moromii]MCK2046457.1 GAF domain-containing protein [Chromohalobacter moromii]MCT8505963.1 GAF domain-containing protein [Chromohalobacter moromii]MCT8516017.1 GAF domain-containing protein [Chromohalobacter sp. TMW 2.2271]
MSDYALLARQLETLLDTRDWLTNAAQTCAFLKHEITDLNWAGFYLQRQPRTLILGPFQGLPACNPIAFDKGVCGAAATTRRTQRVADVHAFPGHIACDAASRSELVVPIVHDGELWGVLDLDSPRPERFSEDDQRGIERLVDIFIAASDLSTPSVTG